MTPDMPAWMALDQRIAIRRNPATGSWRVTEGGRLAYYAQTYDQAVDRADELIAKQRAKRAADVSAERWGDLAALERERAPRQRRNRSQR